MAVINIYQHTSHHFINIFQQLPAKKRRNLIRAQFSEFRSAKNNKYYYYYYCKFLNMSIVEMRVHMCCGGCESKIRKYLQKLEGIDNVDIDMPMQKVTVTGYTDQKKVLKTVRRTGRRAELWQFPYNPEVNNYSNQYYNQQSQASSTTHYYNNTAQPSSSYNYYKHGYAGHDHGYYHQPTHTNILDERAGAMFSDENPNACSVM